MSEDGNVNMEFGRPQESAHKHEVHQLVIQLTDALRRAGDDLVSINSPL